MHYDSSFSETLNRILNEVDNPEEEKKDMHKTDRVVIKAVASELGHNREKRDLISFNKHPKFDGIKTVNSIKLYGQRTPMTLNSTNLNITVRFVDIEGKAWTIRFNKFKVADSSLTWDRMAIVLNFQTVCKAIPEYMSTGEMPDYVSEEAK